MKGMDKPAEHVTDLSTENPKYEIMDGGGIWLTLVTDMGKPRISCRCTLIIRQYRAKSEYRIGRHDTEVPFSSF
jgi:hypothetical protein